MQIVKKIGLLLLSIWLILTGLIGIMNLKFNGLSSLMALLAIGAGILLLIDR